MLWLRKGCKYDDIFIEKAKYNPGIMVYGAIGKDYKSELVICDNSINDIEYRKIIEKSKMFESLSEKYKEGEYYFMKDGASAHKSFLTYLYLKKRCSFIKFWPSNSPDMNPIEHL